MATRKVRPGHRIAQMLVSGEPVSIVDIRKMFEADPVLAPTAYKISGYVGDIRKYDGGVVKVVKNGREVVSYQLLNAREFDDRGQRLVGEALTAVQSAMDPSVPVAAVSNPYTSIEVHEGDEVVTSEPSTDEVVTSEEPSTDEVVTSDAPAEEVAAVTEEPAPVAEKPARNKGRFAKKAA